MPMVLSLPVLVPTSPTLWAWLLSVLPSLAWCRAAALGWVGQIVGEGLPKLMCSDSGPLQPYSSFGAPQQRSQCPPLPTSLTFLSSPWHQLLMPGNVETLNVPTMYFLVVGWHPASGVGLEVTRPLSRMTLMEPQLFTSPFQDPTWPEAVGVIEDMTKP